MVITAISQHVHAPPTVCEGLSCWEQHLLALKQQIYRLTGVHAAELEQELLIPSAADTE